MDEPLSAQALTAAEATARHLAGLFAELRGGVSPSRIAGVDLSAAACFRRARRLMVFLCDTKTLTLWSWFSHWWLVDDDGFRRVTDWDVIRPFIGAIEGSIESPHVKFAVCCGRVRFGIRLGPEQYVSLEGDLDPDGSPVVDSLGDPTPPALNRPGIMPKS